jgi:hypothetical protein
MFGKRARASGQALHGNKKQKIENVAIVPTLGSNVDVLRKLLEQGDIRSTVNGTFTAAFDPKTGSPLQYGKSPGGREYQKSLSRLALSPMGQKLRLSFFHLPPTAVTKTPEKLEQIHTLKGPFYDQPQKIVYIVIDKKTLAEAAGKPRLDADKIMGATAADYAAAFGYDEQPNNKFHWGHGSAHMFGDIAGISPENKNNLAVITHECNKQMLQYESWIRKLVNDSKIKRAGLKITMDLLKNSEGKYLHIADIIHYDVVLDGKHFTKDFYGLEGRIGREARRASKAVTECALFDKENISSNLAIPCPS